MKSGKNNAKEGVTEVIREEMKACGIDKNTVSNSERRWRRIRIAWVAGDESQEDSYDKS